MATGLFNWSRTPASNATATYTWAEGMAPSSVNDSARGIMADVAQWRDDISGAITTGGTSTSYTVTSYSTFTSLAVMSGQLIAFTPHATNGASPTLNVDGLGAKAIRAQPDVDLQSGVLIQGTPYVALYNNSDAVFYLHGVGPDPGIPLGSSIDYWGTTAPSSHFVLAYGQAISRTTYSTLFSLFSTTYGTGDGSTTFNVPDLRGRVIAGKDDMGGSAASRLTSVGLGVAGTTLGNAGASESYQLETSNLPPYTPSGSVSTSIETAGQAVQVTGTNNVGVGGTYSGGQLVGINATSTFTGTAQGGTSAAFSRCQPTIIANKLLRII